MTEAQKKIAKLGKTVKVGKVDIAIKPLTLTERAEVLDVVFADAENVKFSSLVKYCQIGTSLSDDELNEFGVDELTQIATAVTEQATKKKLKK